MDGMIVIADQPWQIFSFGRYIPAEIELTEMEKRCAQAMRSADGDKKFAASKLGITTKCLNEHLRSTRNKRVEI